MLALGLFVVAVLQGRWWPTAAAAGGAVLTVVLSALVLRMDRHRRVEVAATRAKIAADYAAEHARYSSDHRSFTEHLVELLETASNRIGILRRRVDRLESELAAMRSAPAERPAPAPGLSGLASGGQLDELWPDLAEAPTVVDLVKWDARTADDDDRLLPDHVEEDDQRSA